MKRQIASLLALLAAPTVASAQGFTNLDFESASTVGATPPMSLLAWETAAPGWGHSAGADTDFVFYGAPHTGVTQWFLLVDEATSDGVLAGNFALRFSSGYSSSTPGSPWVFAYLSQSGTVPLDAQSLRFIASGPLALRINGAPVSLHSTGAQSYAADVSAFAGSLAEIQFTNTSTELFSSVTLDAIAFSTSPVPELPTSVLLLLGVAALQRFQSKPSIRRNGDA